ncbi:hypothetical protein [Sphingobacterium paludis]|uniref:Uncharacterized protein n=1 Tax=Sphingobacterium paludis TaxID=1476465 RepID=A0A4R7D2S7_9SPHI|nr:hypothetical protein [Sphingobacterium paludis]TDS13116.1 hypothetical protein B0I21_105250 [Sphingobacterium paludis]
MNISKLNLFTKETDASATEKGFHFQKLKTLKSWLENRIQEKDEDIFCDYEEDIFQRDIYAGIAKFRQIKLYSTNFSFSKEEIKKSIAHFFMLFVKGNYLFDEVTFLFETNSGIARETRGNDAGLLLEWYKNQDNMSKELLEKCRLKVKVILDEYINEVYENRMDSISKSDLQTAKIIYDQLSDETWSRFIKSIKWQFDEIDQVHAIPKIVAEIETLISQLPLPIDKSKRTTYISVLHYEIAQKSLNPDEESSKITNQLLDILLLGTGDEDHQWYADTLHKWKHVEKVNQFNIGVFFELISAVRYCRWEMGKTAHLEIWLPILIQYIEHPDIIVSCKRKAIYEFLFLLLSPNLEDGSNIYDFEGQEELIRFYFENIDYRLSLSSIEEDITLMQLLEVQILNGTVELTLEDLKGWKINILNTIDQQLLTTTSIDDRCQLLELKGSFHYHTENQRPLKDRMRQGLDYYRQIIPLLPETHSYSITKLSEIMNQILEQCIKAGRSDEELEEVEVFLNEIEEHAKKTSNQSTSAQTLADRAAAYVEKPSVKNFLKALECLHRAKELFQLKDTKENYIIVMLGLSEVYSILGLNIAAKQYALAGVWACFHFGEATALNRISDSYAYVFRADYNQGAWISALDDFRQYIKVRIEFKSDAMNIEADAVYRNILIELAVILICSPVLYPELSVFIENQKKELGWIYTEELPPLLLPLERKFSNTEEMKKILRGKITGVPLSDLGQEREILFKSMNIDWLIKFKNTAQLNAIGEEFSATLQIVLSEIKASGKDFKFRSKSVKIKILESAGYSEIMRPDPDNTDWWTAGIPVFESTDQQKMRLHYAFVGGNVTTLLMENSFLYREEFNILIKYLYENRKLADKIQSMNIYQKLYFNLLKPEDFNGSQRQYFSKPTLDNDYYLLMNTLKDF